MRKNATPALAPALLLLVGAWFGASPAAAPHSGSVPLACLLIGLGWAWRAELGRLVAWAALGILLVWVQPGADATCMAGLDLARPVTLVGAGSVWQRTDTGWKSTIAVRRIRQGPEVSSCRVRVAVTTRSAKAPENAATVRAKGYLRRHEVLGNAADRHRSPARIRPWRLYLKSQRLWDTSPLRDPTFERRLWKRVLSGLDGARLSQEMRGWVGESFAGVESRSGVRAARALLLGDKSALEDDFRRTLRRFGLSHLFAVSGLHVALVILMANWLLRGLRHAPKLILTIGVVVAYLVLVGARPSIIRATAMALLAFGAVLDGRPPHSRQALCLAAAALVIVSPTLVASLGFQLTVSATAGILWLAPQVESRWSWVPRPLSRPLAATLGAQLASLPFAASTFSLVHPLGPLLNLVAIPWMAFFALTSFLASAVMRAVPASRELLAGILDVGVMPVSVLSSLGPSPWFTRPVALSLGEACLLAACLIGVLLLVSVGQRLVLLALAVVLLQGPEAPDFAEMAALDVGQGDAILLRDGSEAVLVDGGGWRSGDIGASVLVPTLARLGIRRLSVVVVTHPDIDHCRGLVDLSYYLPIERIWSASGAGKSACVRELVSRPNIRWRELWRGESAKIGRLGFDVLHPSAGSGNRGNDSSLVLRAALGGRSVLMTGDIEARTEAELLRLYRPEELRSQVLKVAHHGSKTSTTARFVDAVAPKIAVVSAGRRNLYGHPAAEVLERLERRHIAIARTDHHGLIQLPLEGSGARFRRGRR